MSNITSVKCLKCGGFYPPEFLMSGRHVCGSDVPRSRVPDDYGTRERVYSGSVADIPAAATWGEVRQPVHAGTLQANFVLPLLQAVASALIVWIVFTVVSVALYRTFFDEWLPLDVAVMIGGVIAALTLALFWFRFLSESRETLFHTTRYEAAAPQPERAPETPRVRVRLDVEEKNTMRFAHLPIDESTLRTVARALDNGRSFSVNSLTGSGAPLSRQQFETLRDWLIKNAYAEWVDENHHRAGVNMTRKGQAFWRALALP